MRKPIIGIVSVGLFVVLASPIAGAHQTRKLISNVQDCEKLNVHRMRECNSCLSANKKGAKFHYHPREGKEMELCHEEWPK
jgi:hypothetical protein